MRVYRLCLLAGVIGSLCCPALAQGRFELADEVRFPESLFMGNVTALDVAENGDLLVTDQFGERLYLFRSDGTLLRELDPTECHPGYETKPLGAYFGPDFILMLNAATWGFRFGRSGECLGDVDESFRARRSTDITESGEIVSVFGNPGEPLRLRQMDATGKMLTEIPLFEVPFPNAARRFQGGALVALDDGFLLAQSVSPHVYRFDADGTVVETWSEEPNGYQPLDGDIPANLKFADHRELGQKYMGFSATIGLWLLRSDRVIVVFRQPGVPRWAWIVYDLSSGEVVQKGEDMLLGFLSFRDGYGYRARLPDDGSDRGPYLEKYRWIESEQN